MRVSTNRENKVHPPTWNVGWFGASGSDLDWELLMGVTIKHANNPSGFRSSGGFTKLENNKIFSKFIKLRTIKLLDYWLRLLLDFWITGFRLLFQINPAKNYFTSSDPQHDTLFWRMTLFLTYNLEVYMAYVNIYIYLFIYILWHSFWHVLWHSVWRSFWHTLWHSIWPSFWHCIWYIYIYSDILSGILSGMCSGPGVPSCLQSLRVGSRRSPQEARGKGRSGEVSKTSGAAPVLKSRDPHLPGGKNRNLTSSKIQQNPLNTTANEQAL